MKASSFRGNVIYALYTGDSILAGPDDNELNKVICNMKSTGLELTKEGNLSDFLGVNIDRKADGTIHLMQRCTQDCNCTQGQTVHQASQCTTPSFVPVC